MGQLLQQIQTRVLDPMFNQLLPHFDSPEARVMLLAIGLQESRSSPRGASTVMVLRAASGSSSAVAVVVGVLTSAASRDYARRRLLKLRNVAPSADSVWRRLEFDDLLAAAICPPDALGQPASMPALGRGGEAWDYYKATWRPGRPRVRTWNGYYAQALEQVRA
jgi:hypothetical protein